MTIIPIPPVSSRSRRVSPVLALTEDRGTPVETLRRGGSPEGIVLSPDSASLAECGITRSMGVWEHLWEDSAANQAALKAEKERLSGMVTSFMEEFPDVGRSGPAVTGEEEDESEKWDEDMKKKRAEMEAAVAAVREKKKSALEEAAGVEAAEDKEKSASISATPTA